MLEIALEITLCLLIAALIGFILGFIVAKATNKKPNTTNEKKNIKPKEKTPIFEKTIEDEIETLIETVTEKTEEISTKQPKVLDVPNDNKKDMLTQIKGIGPKIEEQLNAAGIYHFEQIANWDEKNIQWLEENTTFAHRAKKDLWVNQAKSLL